MTRRIGAAAIALLAATLSAPGDAFAGGLYLAPRGVRPLGRGGAFIAGADDPGAIWYNPAGLAWSGQQVLVDGTLTLFRGRFTRIDDGGNVLPRVEAEVAPIPIPTIGFTRSFLDGMITAGGGLFAPNAVLLSWPETVTDHGVERPAPQRYSLISMEGSALAMPALGVAFRPVPEFSFGAAVHLVTGTYQAEVVMSACDYGTICSFPESPEWDAQGVASLDGITAPTVVLGATGEFGIARAGLSWMLPFSLEGEGTFVSRLPDAPIFDGARVDGERAHMGIRFPAIWSAGLELRPIPPLRAELAYVIEKWSVQESIRIEPIDVWIRDANALGDYEVGPIEVPRHMRDVRSFRLGAEWTDDSGSRPWTARAGLTVENSAFPDEYLTPLTLDANKTIVAIGGGVEVARGFQVELTLAHAFMADPEIQNSRVLQPNPIRPPPQDDNPDEYDIGDRPVIGNGDYEMEATLIGVGLRWTPDDPDHD